MLDIYDQDYQAQNFILEQSLPLPSSLLKFLSFESLARARINQVRKQRIHDSEFSIRPLYLGKNSNVLGRIHDSVLLMCKDEHPEYSDYAVCLADKTNIFGKVYSEPNGGVAIILNRELFNGLYSINHIYDLVTSQNSFTPDKRMNLLVVMVCLFEQLFRNRTYGKKCTRAKYKNERELWRTHIITNCQQQYILLHEFGHIATKYKSDKCKRTEIEETNDEFLADQWAAIKILNYGKRFYPTWLQLRSLLWLFELMHFSETLGKDSNEYKARNRFDQIREIIDPDANELPMETVIQERQDFDEVILSWDSLLYKLRDK